MKRSIIMLVCSFMSAAILLAQTDSTQTPTTPATTQKTSAPTAKTGTSKTTAGNKTTGATSKTGVSKTTSATTSKPATSTAAPGKSTPAAASKTGTPQTATTKTTPVTGSKPAIAKTSPTALGTTTGSGLKYQDVVVGKGPQPNPGDDILVNYTGRFTNGKIFDSSSGRGPFELHLGRGEVIKGWDEGISTMRVGGKRKLIIPPGLAYGPGGYPGVIPPNSTLTFDVELVKIK